MDNTEINNDIYIKARRTRGGIYFVISLIFLAASVFCMLLSVTSTFKGEYSMYLEIAYFVIGVAGVIFFAYNTTFNLLRLISPQTAVVITEAGLYDYTVPDGGIAYVAWDNIADIKLFGKKKCDWLGLSLKSTSKVFLGLSKRTRRDIRDNIETGMPAVILKSDDIGIDLYELRSMINENIKSFREADRTKVFIGKPSAGSASKPSVDEVYGKARDNSDTLETVKTAPIEEIADEATAELELTGIGASRKEERATEEPKPLLQVMEDEDESAEAPSKEPEKLQTVMFDDILSQPKAPEQELPEPEKTPETEAPEVMKRTIEIPRRPESRKNVKKENIDDIDDILTALSASYKKKNEKKSGFESPLSEILKDDKKSEVKDRESSENVK